MITINLKQHQKTVPYETIEQSPHPHDAMPMVDRAMGVLATEHQLGQDEVILGGDSHEHHSSDGRFEELLESIERWRQEMESGDRRWISPYNIKPEWCTDIAAGNYSVEVLAKLVDAICAYGQYDAGELLRLLERVPKAMYAELQKVYSDERSNPLAGLWKLPIKYKYEAGQVLRIRNKAGIEDSVIPTAMHQHIRDLYKDSPGEYYSEQIPTWPESHAEQDISEYNTRVVVHALAAMAGMRLPIALQMRYLANARVRHRNFDSHGVTFAGAYDGQTMRSDMSFMRLACSALGDAAVAQLHSKLDVESLESYELDDLVVLDKLLNKDQGTIEHLQSVDVTVVFFDSRTSVIPNEISHYRMKNGGKTLYFEIHDPRTMKERLDWLRSMGIRCSAIVLANHGGPGSLEYLTNPGKAVHLRNHRATSAGGNISVVPIDTIDFSLLTSDAYMQPGRGKGCAPDVVGKKVLIVSACYSSALVQRKGERVREGLVPSIVRRAKDPALVAYGSAARMIEEGDSYDGRVRFINLRNVNPILSSYAYTWGPSPTGGHYVRRRPVDDVPIQKGYADA